MTQSRGIFEGWELPATKWPLLGFNAIQLGTVPSCCAAHWEPVVLWYVLSTSQKRWFWTLSPSTLHQVAQGGSEGCCAPQGLLGWFLPTYSCSRCNRTRATQQQNIFCSSAAVFPLPFLWLPDQGHGAITVVSQETQTHFDFSSLLGSWEEQPSLKWNVGILSSLPLWFGRRACSKPHKNSLFCSHCWGSPWTAVAQGLLRYEERAGSLLLQAEEASQPQGVGFMRLIAGWASRQAQSKVGVDVVPPTTHSLPCQRFTAEGEVWSVCRRTKLWHKAYVGGVAWRCCLPLWDAVKSWT